MRSLPQSFGIGGVIGNALDTLLAELRSLRPVAGPGSLYGRNSQGTFRTGGSDAVAAPEGLRRLTLVTERDYYLECDDDGTAVNVAKPDAFYTDDASGLVVQSFSYTAFGGGAPYSEPDAPSVTGVTTQDSALGFVASYVTDTEAPTHHSHKLLRLVEIDGNQIHQVITPPYRNAESIIYAARLAKPLELAGESIWYIDTNIDARRWESINYSPYSADGALYPNAPISLTRAVRTRA